MFIKWNIKLINNKLFRNYSLEIPNPLPVIKVPKYLRENLNKIRFKEEKRAKQIQSNLINDQNLVKNQFNRNVLIISGKNKKYNHHLGQLYANKDRIPLISKKWIKANTNGEKMQFHIYDENPSKLINETNDQKMTFSSLGLNSTLCDAIHSMSIREPTLIQTATIPSILDNKNIICSAETGSGKTIAYLAPIMQMIRDLKQLKSEQTNRRYPRGLIVVPSRELAEQVGQVAQHLAAFCGIGVAVMIGGIPKHITHTGMDLIVSTIGLVQPLINKGIYSLKRLNHLVIDESDTLFDDTFSFDVLDLLQSVLVRDNVEEEELSNLGTQIVCVSATMPKNLEESLGSVVDLENIDRITTGSLHHIMPHVKQIFYRIHKYDKQSKLLELVKKDSQTGRPVMIFSNRSNASNWVYHYLNQNGIKCLRLNKEIPDEQRFDEFNKFQSGECDVISCTDLGSRGLDTRRVRHVINYDCPHYVSDYIHRSGRTGRIGTDGNCLVSTLVSFKPDVLMLQDLEMALRLNKPIDSVDANIKQQLNNFSNELKRKKRRKY